MSKVNTNSQSNWRNLHNYIILCSPVVTYVFEPRFQNIVPNIRAMTVVKINLTAVYSGLRQYDQCCFHKQAVNWVKYDCEY